MNDQYSFELLNKLVKLYDERADKFQKTRNPVTLLIRKANYPSYFNDKDNYDEVIKDLVAKEYITAKYDKNELDHVTLNTKKIIDIKSLLGMDVIAFKTEMLLDELARTDIDALVSFRAQLKELLFFNNPIDQFLTDDYFDAIKAIKFMEKLNKDMYEKDASNALFKNPKRLTQIKPLIQSLYNNYNILEEKGIITFTPYVYLKGSGVVILNGFEIDLKKAKTPIGVPIFDIKNISFEDIDEVTIIENLLVFQECKAEGFIICLTGYLSRSQINILKKLKKLTNKFNYIADIDYYGLLFLNNISEELNVNVNPINMDMDTIEANKEETFVLNDERYIKNLNKLLSKPLLENEFDVIKYLIENQVFVKQKTN